MLGAGGCSSGEEERASYGAPECPGRIEERLVAAATEETYLGLAPAQQRAVVALVDDTGESEALCSGVLVAPSWVLSAAHCSVIPSLSVSVLSADSTRTLVPVGHREVHPTLDLALFELDFASLSPTSALELGVTPVPASAADLGLVPGDAVELAGFGTTESGKPAGLRFLVESIVEVDTASIVVDGFGVTGACTGDSGGPLLARSSDGSLQVGGILTTGSSTCTSRDRYVRLDTAAGWVEEIAGSSDVPRQACGSIDDTGRCLRGAALWCEGGLLQTSDCSGLGEGCGWDSGQAGFRCVEARATTCAELDGLGVCRPGATVACVAGAPLTVPCGNCASCRIDGRTGAPYCAPVE